MLALCVRTSSTSGGDAQAGGFPQTDLCCACRGRRRRPQAETAAGPSHSAGFVPRRACQIQICAPVMATRDSTSRPTQPFGNGFCGLSDARMPGDCCLLSRHNGPSSKEKRKPSSGSHQEGWPPSGWPGPLAVKTGTGNSPPSELFAV